MTLSDLKRLFKLLGPLGTRAGLLASSIDRATLRNLADKARLELEGHLDREEIIAALVQYFDKPALKPTDQLMSMNYEQLIAYFNDIAPSSEQLLNVMRELNYKVSAEDKKHLRRYVARQISETALFSQVATRESERDKR